MDKIWVALLSIIFGALLTIIGKFFTAKFSSNTKNKISLRKQTLKRISDLERQQDKLEEEVQIWTLRYWSLYRWIINFCNTQDIEVLPPNFHEIEKQQMQEEDINHEKDKK